MTLQQFRQDKRAQRKLFIFAALVLAGVFWLRSGGGKSGSYEGQAPAARAVMATKPSPVAAVSSPASAAGAAPPLATSPAVATALPAVTPAAAPNAPTLAPVPPDPMANVARILAGKWEGIGTVSEKPPRGCRLDIEVRRQDKDKDAPPFEAYSILSCMPMLTSNWRGSNYTVTSAVLSGTGHDGVVPSISFGAVNNIGVNESFFKCGMKTLVLEAFGDGRSTAKWKEDGPAICAGGEVVMGSRRGY
jgi:hypothetical protein